MKLFHTVKFEITDADVNVNHQIKVSGPME